MSDSVDAKRAWVERVLGFRFPGAAQGGGAPDEMDLTGRLRSAGNALRALPDASAPQAAELATRYAQVMVAAKTDPTTAAASLGALERDIARATSAVRAGEAAPAKAGRVAYGKLLLRWRAAQATLNANLKTLAATVLARPDIQADPRLDEIEAAVAELPDLVPAFGGSLEDALDAAMSATDDGARVRLERDAVVAIDAYRAELAAASALLELEVFAATDLGAGLPLHGALDQALTELKQQLAA